MLEYEKKILLTAKEYSLLIESFYEGAIHKIQTNYYYDTDDFEINKLGITCRVRMKNGVFETTIKKHNKNDINCSCEDTRIVSNEFDDSFFKKEGLKLKGSLVTERTMIFSDSIVEVVLDKNTYLGTTDYELEIEYQPNFEKEADVELRKIAEKLYNSVSDINTFCDRTKFCKSKSERFFKRLRCSN